jgi:hypothetical protein
MKMELCCGQVSCEEYSYKTLMKPLIQNFNQIFQKSTKHTLKCKFLMICKLCFQTTCLQIGTE